MKTIQVEETMQVNEVIRAYPQTVTVFSRHGIDSCCGGAKPLAEVAERHQLDLQALIDELVSAAGDTA